MKRFVFLAALIALVMSCQPVVEVVDYYDDPTDPRVSMVDAASYKWLRKPTLSRGIEQGDPIAAYCTTPGWSYLFYDDGAVIGYEPFPEAADVMQRAVSLTVEAWNQGHPNQLWGYINVPPIAPPPPVTSFDPVLSKWQVCFCLDDGTIVWGPITAEYEFNWVAFKSSIPSELEIYNRDHDPNAHAVWGPDTDPIPEEPEPDE